MASESLVGLPCSSEEEEPVSKKRGKGKEYHFFASFDTLKQAEDSLKEERLWTKVGIRKKLVTTGAYQQFYQCCRVKFREKQFCTGCVIISPADKTSVEVHKTICAHDHI
jgi:hypothetical protein